MLDPLSLSSSVVKSFHSAAGAERLCRGSDTEFVLRSHRENLRPTRVPERVVYQQCAMLGKTARKLSRRKNVPRLCAGQFNELNRNAVGSSTIKTTADGGTSLNDIGNGPPSRLSSSSSPRPLCISDERDSHRAFEHANTVGILGGLNPLATVEFMRKIVDASAVENQGELIPVLLCSDPNMRKRVASSRVPTKSIFNPALLEESWAGAEEIELLTVEPLIQKRIFLEASGAKCIVMPCHVSHLWFDQIADGCTVPFLHMVDCVIDELKAADLRPLEAGIRPKIGILGSEATLTSDFYQEKLRSEGFDVVLPDKATMEHAVIPGIVALQRRDMEGARNLLRIAVQVLLVNAVNMVVLACHNMPTVFAADDPILRKCVDPTHALARAAIIWSKTTRGVTS